MTRPTKNSKKSSEDFQEEIPQEISGMDRNGESSGSHASVEERISLMEKTNAEEFEELSVSLKTIMSSLSQKIKKLSSLKRATTSVDEGHSDAVDSPRSDSDNLDTDDEESWRHMSVNLTKCQHMVDRWPGQKKMDFMLWSVSFRRATVSLDIWDFFKCFQFLESHLPLDVSTNLQPFDDEPNSSRKAWVHLCTKYGKTDKETVRTLLNSLSNIKMQQDETGEDYFERAQKMRNSLAARRTYLDDSDFTDYLIQGLQQFPSYIGVEQQYEALKADGDYMSPKAVEKSIMIAARMADPLRKQAAHLFLVRPSHLMLLRLLQPCWPPHQLLLLWRPMLQ